MTSEHTPGADALDTFLNDSYTHVDPLSGLDPTFVFDFNAYDDLADGQRIEVLVPTRKGEPGNPLTADELGAKFLALVAGSTLSDHATALSDWVEALDRGGSGSLAWLAAPARG